MRVRSKRARARRATLPWLVAGSSSLAPAGAAAWDGGAAGLGVGPGPGVAALFALLGAARIVAFHTAARSRGCRARPALPLPLAARLVGVALAGGLGALAPAPLGALAVALEVALVLVLGAERTPSAPPAPSVESPWRPLSSDELLALRRRRPLALLEPLRWVDLTSWVGLSTLPLAAAALWYAAADGAPPASRLWAPLGALGLWMLGTAHELPVPLLERADRILALARALRSGPHGFALRPVVREPRTGPPDEIALEVLPRRAPEGLEALRLALVPCACPGGPTLVPVLLVATVPGSAADSAAAHALADALVERGARPAVVRRALPLRGPWLDRLDGLLEALAAAPRAPSRPPIRAASAAPARFARAL